MRPHINILSANCDFWSILGRPGLPKWTPKLTLGVKIRTQLGSGGAQGAPRANFSRFLVNFGVILGRRMVILGPFWDAFWSIRQQTAANCSKDGHFGTLLGRLLQQKAANISKQLQIAANNIKLQQTGANISKP